MKKLNVLKIIIDLFLFLTIPLLLLTLFFTPYILRTNEIVVSKINGLNIATEDNYSKLIFLMIIISYVLLIYCVFIFRKIIVSFKKRILFNDKISSQFKKLGLFLILSSFLNGIPTLFYKLFYTKENILVLSINSFLILFTFGLFFIVLSEIFLIAFKTKSDNELTI